MYSVFKPLWRSWRNQVVQAKLLTPLPPFHELDPAANWWEARPLQSPLPMLTFAVNKHAPFLDNYRTDWSFDLYSTRLIELLRNAGIQFETFPATLLDYKTDEPLPQRYAVFHLLEIHPCIDLEQSGHGTLILCESCLQHKRPLFRPAEAIQLVLMHQSLHIQLNAAQITGCAYEPLSRYGDTPVFPPRHDR
jgi:hypothetical protein